MSYEVVHTSVARGLRGETGFATAILTRGIPAGLEAGLQDVSGYDHDATRAVGVDTIEWAHRIVTVRGRGYTVLSRIAPNGVDASRRPNRIAHHLVLDPHDRALAGPAWMLGQFKDFETGMPDVSERAKPPVLPTGDLAVRPAHAWRVAGFDPGWAGMVAQALLDAPQSSVYVVLPAAMDALPLVIDVLALLPVDRRWHVTFSTRPLVMLPQVRCQLRFVRSDAPGVARLLSEPGARVIRVERDVDAGESAAAVAAREGQIVEPSSRPVNTKVHPVFQPLFHPVGQAPFESSSSVLRETASAAGGRVINEGERAPEAGPFDRARGTSVSPGDTWTQRDTGAVNAPTPEPLDATPRVAVSWPPLALALFAYSGLAVLGALILFLLAAFGR